MTMDFTGDETCWRATPFAGWLMFTWLMEQAEEAGSAQMVITGSSITPRGAMAKSVIGVKPMAM